ncbi:hypothetical protein WJX84_010297 [Apatococcus fuscideae]|uniref:Uncharacterized protein n=1 Tax=Apatococcus fuscideae TaxID=2026836 RepID=A0AAW1T359_9CHLO
MAPCCDDSTVVQRLARLLCCYPIPARKGLDPSAHAVTLRVGLSEPQKRSSRLRQSRGAAANIAASSTDSGDNFLFGARPGLESSEGFSHKAGERVWSHTESLGECNSLQTADGTFSKPVGQRRTHSAQPASFTATRVQPDSDASSVTMTSDSFHSEFLDTAELEAGKGAESGFLSFRVSAYDDTLVTCLSLPSDFEDQGSFQQAAAAGACRSLPRPAAP